MEKLLGASPGAKGRVELTGYPAFPFFWYARIRQVDGLQTKNRLRSSREYARVYRRKRVHVNKYLVIYSRPNELGRTRFGFSVSKKVGKSVIRNRCRRRLKEICRTHIEQMEKGYDVVLVARPAAAAAEHAKLQGAFRHLLHVAGLFRVKSRE